MLRQIGTTPLMFTMDFQVKIVSKCNRLQHLIPKNKESRLRSKMNLNPSARWLKNGRRVPAPTVILQKEVQATNLLNLTNLHFNICNFQGSNSSSLLTFRKQLKVIS